MRPGSAVITAGRSKPRPLPGPIPGIPWIRPELLMHVTLMLSQPVHLPDDEKGLVLAFQTRLGELTYRGVVSYVG